MMDYSLLEKAYQFVAQEFSSAQPEMCFIFGSGWGPVAAVFEEQAALPYPEIPGFGQTGVAGHRGALTLGQFQGKQALLFQGRRHFYEGEGFTPIALPVFIAKKMGVKILVITNAAGAISSALAPGDVVTLSDHVNAVGTNPLIGAHHDIWGPRFPDMTAVYDQELRAHFRAAGQDCGVVVKEGVYAWSSGPAYETPAEVRALEQRGADLAGMSTVPEATLAHAGGLRVLGVCCVSNFAAGKSAQQLKHEEVIDTTQRVMSSLQSIVRQFVVSLA